MRRLCGETVFFLACLALAFLSSADGASPNTSAAFLTAAEFPVDAGSPVAANHKSAATSPAAANAESEAKPDESKATSGKADEEKATDDPPNSKSDGESTTASKKDEDQADKKSDDVEKPAKKSVKPNGKDRKKAKPYKVKHDKLKIEVELDGTFVAGEMEEVALRPEVWSRFTVVEAVEHGAKVKKGDVLVRFDDEKIEEELADESIDQRIAELSLMQDEEELPRMIRLLELSFEAAKRKHEQVLADYDYYHSTDRPFTVEIAHFRYKSAEEELAAAQEELDQLQKMYAADELTEETEEIVLRRQRFAVETAELVLKLNRENRDYTLNVSLPRSDERYETAKEEAELSFKQAKTALEVGTTRKSFEMEKKRKSRALSVERNGKLLSDKGLMTVRAPTDGVVYYGQCTNGKWSQIASLQAKLTAFGTATPNTILMTIVKPGSLHIESSLGEKELPDLKPGLQATVIPTADKEMQLAGKVSQVGAIPGASNKFVVELDFDNAQTPAWLVAGMTCAAKVVTYENKKTLVVPLDLVQTDEDNDKIKYVMLVVQGEDGAAAGEPVRREIKLGREQGKVVEVLKGLAAGDEIVKEKKPANED